MVFFYFSATFPIFHLFRRELKSIKKCNIHLINDEFPLGARGTGEFGTLNMNELGDHS